MGYFDLTSELDARAPALGQLDLVGGLVGSAVGIYTQQVAAKNAKALAKHEDVARLIDISAQGDVQAQSDQAAAARTATLVSAAKVVAGIGAGALVLYGILGILGGGRRRAASSTATAPIIVVKKAAPAPAKAANRRRSYSFA